MGSQSSKPRPSALPQPATGGPITYRRATPGDRGAALAISAHFPNDWLVYGIDQMTAQGRFFVAEQDGRVIAVCGYDGLGEVAWLQAMRVHPEVHNRGVATAFTVYIMEECRKAGFKVARLDTKADNYPVHRLAGGKLGFRPRGRFFVVEGPGDRFMPAGPPGGANIRPGSPADLEAAWAFLVRRVSEGHLDPFDLAPCPKHWWEIGNFDWGTLARWLESGHVLLAETGTGSVTGLAAWSRFTEEPEAGTERRESFVYVGVSYLEGDPATQAALLAAIVERSRVPAPPDVFYIGLLESQWRTVWPLLDPSWVSGPEGVFEAVIYDKELL